MISRPLPLPAKSSYSFLHKSGAYRLSLHNVVERGRIVSVGDDHLAAAAEAQLCRPQLGHHAAGSLAGAADPGQLFDAFVQAPHQRNQLGTGIGVGVGCVQTIDVR